MHCINTWQKSSIIIKESMIDNMQPGSIIYDLATIQGGNTAFTQVGKVIEKRKKLWVKQIFLINYHLQHQTFMQKMSLILS